jgi:hypothetical protein
MNVISSHRPMAEDSEIARNQKLAHRTWEMWARNITYFGPKEFELQSPKTTFVESEQFPHIVDLMNAAAFQRGFTAIMNADIVVKPDIRKLERMMMLRGKLCASSRRYHFDPNTCDWAAAELGDDRGRDIFIARWDIWRDAARWIPPELRIGNARWDAWVTDYFRAKHNDAFLDFTNMRIVFHPIHGSRKRPYDEEISKLHFSIPS